MLRKNLMKTGKRKASAPQSDIPTFGNGPRSISRVRQVRHQEPDKEKLKKLLEDDKDMVKK